MITQQIIRTLMTISNINLNFNTLNFAIFNDALQPRQFGFK
jgi:hypothetical protein